MKPGALDPHHHSGCGAAIGELHYPGCDVERCALCGGQAIACDCVYTLNGMDPASLEEEHPDIYENGPTGKMLAVYDAAVEKAGGRIPRGQLYPGTEDAVRLGFWCRWVAPGSRESAMVASGWRRCEREHPDAEADLNRLAAEARWNPKTRRYEGPGEQ